MTKLGVEAIVRVSQAHAAVTEGDGETLIVGLDLWGYQLHGTATRHNQPPRRTGFGAVSPQP
jgi:hypothetical protein